MAKIKVSIVNPSTLRLEEKGEPGDLIDLKELQEVDTAPILEAIQNAKDAAYQNLLRKEIQQQEANKQLALNALEQKLSKDYTALKSEKERLALMVESFDKQVKDEHDTTETKLAAQFTVEKGKLESKISELEGSIEEQKKIVILQTEQKKEAELRQKEDLLKKDISDKQKQIDKLTLDIQALSDKQSLLIDKEKIEIQAKMNLSIADKDKAISELKTEIEKLKSEKKEAVMGKEADIRLLNEQLKNKDELKKAEIDKELANQKQSMNELLSQKELEITQLKLSKSNLQVKMLGEELERWCNAEYESYALSGFENCHWYKDNKAVKDAPDGTGTKADYIFEVYANNDKKPEDRLLGVCCEMKNESPETKTKTKNADHYKKLDEDRVKKNCQYSLLISELEWDVQNDAPIKKIPGYENMYMVRPAYFVSFLSLIKSLVNKYRALLLERKIADENFKESQMILEEFDAFKNTYLDKPLKALLDDVEDIKKEANKAYEASYKIVGLADTIISQKIAEIKVKIDRFDIKKIARKVDKISQN